jgi:hypothetical protein
MTTKKNDYGLMLARTNLYGTEYIEVHVVRREQGRDAPLGCSGDGESFYDSGTPKHLVGLRLDGLGMYGFVSDGKDPSFIGADVEYRNVYASDERKLRGMLKTIKRVNDRITKDKAYEPGDKLMAFAAALKLSFVVERIGRAPNLDWRYMSIVEGRNRYRDLIETLIAEKNAALKGAA